MSADIRWAELSRHRGSDITGVDFVVVDVETTGCEVDFGDRVIEVAAVRIRDGEVIDEFATLVNPGQEVDNTEIHGITTADVQGAPTFKKIARTLLSYLSGAVMVSHKAKFDHKFLSHEFNRVEIDIGEIPTLCTLVAARSQLALRVYKLPKVVEQVTGIPPDYEHTALDDARTTGRLLCGFLYDAPEPLRLSTPEPIDWAVRPTLGGVSTRHRVIAADGLDLVHLVKQLPITCARQPVNADFASYELALRQAMNNRKIDPELGELIRCGGLVRAAVEQIRRELLEHHRLNVHTSRNLSWQEVCGLYEIALLFGQPEQVVTEREPILRWTEYWRPCELYVEDCVGRFDKEARARACHRAQTRNRQRQSSIAREVSALAG